jgi:hypothetical protein
MKKLRRRVKRSRVAVGLLVSFAIIGTARAAVVTPTTGAYFGAYVQPHRGSDLIHSVAAFETKLGRTLAIVNKYHDFTMQNYADEASLISSGHEVMVSWHPTDGKSNPNRAREIVAGRWDRVIRTAADRMKALDAPLLLRWDFEMDQDRGQWENIGGPSRFIAAWRHMYNLFQRRGATNVEWMWAPRAQSFKTGRAQHYYPGAGYVDWIGASAVPEKNWAPFAKIFNGGSHGGFYTWASQRHKPLVVWVGVRERPNHPTWKARWLGHLRSTLKRSMTAVKALIYYDAASPDGLRYYAHTSTRAWRAFRGMALDPYFNP